MVGGNSIPGLVVLDKEYLVDTKENLSTKLNFITSAKSRFQLFTILVTGKSNLAKLYHDEVDFSIYKHKIIIIMFDFQGQQWSAGHQVRITRHNTPRKVLSGQVFILRENSFSLLVKSCQGGRIFAKRVMPLVK